MKTDDRTTKALDAPDNVTRHFVLMTDGQIREFTSDQAALIAGGSECVPEFADAHLRYLQVSWSANTEQELRVQTTGGAIHFDSEGRMIEVAPPGEADQISRFEHDTCVQWALRELIPAPHSVN